MQEAIAILSVVLFLSILANIILFALMADESYEKKTLSLRNEIENYKAKTAHLMEIQNHLEKQMSRLEHYMQWQSNNLKNTKE